MELDDSSNTRREFLLPEEEPPEPLSLFSLTTAETEYYYPNVFEEAKDMLLSAILIYGMIDLRALARKNLLHRNQSQDDMGVHNNNQNNNNFLVQRLLSLPIAAKDVVRLVAQYQSAIECEIGRESTELYLDAFRAIQSTSSSYELELDFNHHSGQVSLVGFDVVVVDDEHSESELVYAIALDTARRRITVLFRGCSTKKDWAMCANNFLREVDNPLYSTSDNTNYPKQPTKLAIHSGYCQYLFTKNAAGKSKFDAIIQHVQFLLREHPGYQVYATGHSLGAALATVFAFQAAATQQFTVSVINFASPMVGNLAFETAFRALEAQGKIRCLRVTNHFDIFTQLPDRGNWLYVMACCAWPGIHLVAYVAWSLLFFLCFQTHVYRHVGMDLHMYRRHSSPCFPFSLCYKSNQDKNNKDRFLSGNNNNNNNNSTKTHHQHGKYTYSYKVKHSKGTPGSFAWRVACDWKKHAKQTLQRLMAIPFVLDFNTNHSVQEHLQRLLRLASDLEHVYLNDLLHDAQRSPNNNKERISDSAV